MNTPNELRYTRSDEWVRIEGDIATIGITDYAQSELGDIVFLELPEPGRYLQVDESFGVIESVKAASDLYAPLERRGDRGQHRLAVRAGDHQPRPLRQRLDD